MAIQPSKKDWKLLLTRTPNNVEDIETFKNSSVKLSHGNEKVALDNYESLKKLGKPIATINAKHNNSTVSKLPADYMGSLQSQLLIAKGAKVMLTRNLWTQAGLCNGNKTNDLILNLTPENVTQHSRIE